MFWQQALKMDIMENTNSAISGFAYYHIGTSKSRSYEDRHFLDTVKTEGGLALIVAIVADGVGGCNFGERAAELTIEVVVNSIKASDKSEKQIPIILGTAVRAANKAVNAEAHGSRDKDAMSTTLSMAVVCNNKLYVANVGDSRVYLIRQDEIKQITVDHTFANEKIRQGILSPEQARKHPNKDSITRSVGFENEILVDLGLYLSPDDDGNQAFLNQGMTISNSDVIVLCTDGLIKKEPYRNTPYVKEYEIINTLQEFHAETAAKILVDLAVGRNTDDNVTVVIVESSDRKLKSSINQLVNKVRRLWRT